MASPIFHVSAEAPPYLIMHGSEDPTVPVDQAIPFDEALHVSAVESTLLIIVWIRTWISVRRIEGSEAIL